MDSHSNIVINNNNANDPQQWHTRETHNDDGVVVQEVTSDELKKHGLQNAYLFDADEANSTDEWDADVPDEPDDDIMPSSQNDCQSADFHDDNKQIAENGVVGPLPPFPRSEIAAANHFVPSSPKIDDVEVRESVARKNCLAENNEETTPVIFRTKNDKNGTSHASTDDGAGEKKRESSEIQALKKAIQLRGQNVSELVKKFQNASPLSSVPITPSAADEAEKLPATPAPATNSQRTNNNIASTVASFSAVHEVNNNSNTAKQGGVGRLNKSMLEKWSK